MRRTEKLPELLAPAGSFEALLAAVEGGADAVYVGGKRFGARAFAKNFDIDELSRAVSYCHLHGVKLYVTVNTLVLDIEMAELISYAGELWRIGVDALIIADLGAISEIRKYIPGLELHASTQMSVHNLQGVNAAYDMGCSRVVLARESSLEDIIAVTDGSKAEIEVFLHGALCVCHSGQCLFSSMVGGRSGNRGECAQPCRLPYNGGKYSLSLKDLSLASHIRELVQSGVASLKIEGRMKSASYVYTVTSIYRRLLDLCRDATAEEQSELKRAFSRGGFTDGYLRGRPQAAELGMRTEIDKAESRLAEREFTPIRRAVKAKVSIKRGTPSIMTLYSEDRSVTAYGASAAVAESSPLNPEDVKARLSKMGNTFLSLSPSDIELDLDEGLNIAPSLLNALRRDAAMRFESFEREALKIDYSLPPAAVHIRFRSAVFLGGSVMPDKAVTGFDAIFASLMRDDLPGYINGVYLPPVIFEHEYETVKSRLASLDREKIKYALVSNIGHISLARQFGFETVGDFRLNVTNRLSRQAISAMGVSHIILSPEITLPQARDIGGTVAVYGRIPLMLTERCFIKENAGCKNCDKYSLTDRRGEKFPIIREYEHRNLILNSKLTYMGDKKSELQRCRINSYHFIFTTESPSEITAAIAAFEQGRPLGTGDVRRIGRRI